MSEIRKKSGLLPVTPENYPAKLPDFKTEEEIRDFYDTHDMAFYWDQSEPVYDSRDEPERYHDRPPSTARKRPDRERMELLSLRFPEEMIAGVRTIAEKRHLPYQTLLRSWVAERLEQELANEADRKAS